MVMMPTTSGDPKPPKSSYCIHLALYFVLLQRNLFIEPKFNIDRRLLPGDITLSIQLCKG